MCAVRSIALSSSLEMVEHDEVIGLRLLFKPFQAE